MFLLSYRNRHGSTISSAPCSVYHRCPHFWHLRLRTRLPDSSKRVLVTLVSVFWHSGHRLRGLGSGTLHLQKHIIAACLHGEEVVSSRHGAPFWLHHC